MTTLTRIEDAKKLWNILMPHIELPADRTFGNWATRFPDSAIEAGLVRGSKKFSTRKTESAPVDAENVHRYVSGVIRNEAVALMKEQKAMTVEAKKQLVIAASVKYPELGEIAGRHAAEVLHDFQLTDDFESDVDAFIGKLIKASESAEFEAHLEASADPNDPIRLKARTFVDQHRDTGTLNQMLATLVE